MSYNFTILTEFVILNIGLQVKVFLSLLQSWMAVTAPKVFRPHPVVLSRTGLHLLPMIPSGTPMTPQTPPSAACSVSVQMQRSATKKCFAVNKKPQNCLSEVNPLKNCKPSRTFVELFRILLAFISTVLLWVHFLSLYKSVPGKILLLYWGL